MTPVPAGCWRQPSHWVTCTRGRLSGLHARSLFLACRQLRLLSPITACSACGFHRLGYKGLGEPITFVTFGPLATSAFYLMHVSRLLSTVQPISLDRHDVRRVTASASLPSLHLTFLKVADCTGSSYRHD